MAEFTRKEETDSEENCSKAFSDIQDSGDKSVIFYRVFQIVVIRGKGETPVGG